MVDLRTPAESSHTTSKHLNLPTPSTAQAHKPQNPLHFLPATALFHGPHSHNASHTSLPRQRDDKSSTPIDHPNSQHLPRANPPTSSFPAPRTTPTGEQKYGTSTTGPSSRLPALGPRTQAIPAASSKRQDDFRADAVWAEMQKTLADVELSAMNSSHVFGTTHAKALEELRSAQLGLAQAWAKSEADEMIDEEFGKDENGMGAVGHLRGGIFANPDTDASPQNAKQQQQQQHSRNASTASAGSAGGGLEEETERDIRLARRRREANDRYFKQINRGVLDVVRKLDEVTGAMRRVEKESREIWNESSGSEDLGDVTETDQSVQREKDRKTMAGGLAQAGKPVLVRARSRAATNDTVLTMTTDTDALSSSPESRR